MKKIIVGLCGLVLALALDVNGLAQSETYIRAGGAIYDVSTGSFLGFTNMNTGKEETLASTIGSGLSASSVVCTNASKVLTSTCTSATPSFAATTVTALTATGAVALSPASANVVLSPTGTGVVTINPATAGTMDNVAVGAATRAAGSFTAISVGAAPSINTGALIAGTFANFSDAYGLAVSPTLTPTAGNYGLGINLAPTINIAGSGVHPDFAGLYAQPPTIGAGAGTVTNASTVKITNAPSGGGTNRALWVSAGLAQFDGPLTTTGVTTLKGSATNDTGAAGNIGELLTVTVASGSAVSLTTATSANIATLSVTAGDWDCAAQVTHNAAATTSVTLLQIGISATTATLPTQAGGSGIGTDPLSIFRQAAAVPGGALTTNVGPVRVSLSGTTNLFLVANDTFTVSTMTGYGTLRCRRAR